MVRDNPHVLAFFELVRRAEWVDNEELEIDVEPAFEAVLSHVLAYPEMKQSFLEGFLELVGDPLKGAPQVVEYCMHALRWPEVKEAILTRLATEKSGRIRHNLEGIVAAFDDNWPDAKFYARFVKRGT
jgi:hypothetical protein